MEPNAVPVEAAIAEAAIEAGAAAHGLSPVDLFLQADPIVKAVIILLALASVVCWAIILDKVVRFGRLRRQARDFEAKVVGKTVPELAAFAREQPDIPAAILLAGLEAREDSTEDESRAERRDRIERNMRATLAAELRRMEPGLPFLATVGSAAPFIGLFGTVWGIMSSFTAIAQSQDTSLAVVAPGIAEALFATGLGLVAAIPAVIGYNELTTDLGRAGQRFSAAIVKLGDRLARRSVPEGERVRSGRGAAA